MDKATAASKRPTNSISKAGSNILERVRQSFTDRLKVRKSEASLTSVQQEPNGKKITELHRQDTFSQSGLQSVKGSVRSILLPEQSKKLTSNKPKIFLNDQLERITDEGEDESQTQRAESPVTQRRKKPDVAVGFLASSERRETLKKNGKRSSQKSVSTSKKTVSSSKDSSRHRSGRDSERMSSSLEKEMTNWDSQAKLAFQLGFHKAMTRSLQKQLHKQPGFGLDDQSIRSSADQPSIEGLLPPPEATATFGGAHPTQTTPGQFMITPTPNGGFTFSPTKGPAPKQNQRYAIKGEKDSYDFEEAFQNFKDIPLHSDTDLLERLQEMRTKHDSHLSRVKELKKDKIMDMLSIEILVEQIKDLQEKKDEFISEFKEVKKDNILQAKLIAHFESYADVLEDELEKLANQDPLAGITINQSMSRKNTAFEKKMQQMREANMQRQRTLMKGLEDLDDEDDIYIGKVLVGQSWWRRLFNFFVWLADWLTPFKGLTAKIQLQMDKTVASFFITFRFLIAVSLMNLIGLSFLIVRQILSRDQFNMFETDACGQQLLPCFTVYSGFHENLGFTFAFNFMAFNFVGLFACLYKWRQYDKESKKNEIYNDGKYPLAKRLFNGWVWATNNQDMMMDYRENILADIQFEISRDELLKEIKKRGFTKKVVLMIRRILSTILNIASVIGGLILIVTVNDNSTQVQEYLSKFGIPTSASQLAPSLIVTVLNSSLPIITKQLVLLEKWDFPETKTKQLIWRNFAIKLINLFTFLYVNYDGLLVMKIKSYSSEEVAALQENYHGPLNCTYDKVGEALLNLILTETASMYATQYGTAVAREIVFKRILKRGTWESNINEALPSFCIWMLYGKTVQWLALLCVPYFIIVAPIIDYMSFRYMYHVIRYWYVQKDQNSSDINYFLILLLNATFLYQLMIQLHWFILPREHGCGPILNGYAAWQPIADRIQTTTIGKAIFEITSFYPVLWILIALGVLNISIHNNRSRVFQEFVHVKEDEHNVEYDQNAKQIRKLRRRVEYNRIISIL